MVTPSYGRSKLSSDSLEMYKNQEFFYYHTKKKTSQGKKDNSGDNSGNISAPAYAACYVVKNNEDGESSSSEDSCWDDSSSNNHDHSNIPVDTPEFFSENLFHHVRKDSSAIIEFTDNVSKTDVENCSKINAIEDEIQQHSSKRCSREVSCNKSMTAALNSFGLSPIRKRTLGEIEQKQLQLHLKQQEQLQKNQHMCLEKISSIKSFNSHVNIDISSSTCIDSEPIGILPQNVNNNKVVGNNSYTVVNIQNLDFNERDSNKNTNDTSVELEAMKETPTLKPELTESPTRATTRCVSFDQEIFITWTYTPFQYQRKSIRCGHSLNDDWYMRRVISELENFKEFEMNVHPESKHNTLFYTKNDPLKQRRLLEKRLFLQNQFLICA